MSAVASLCIFVLIALLGNGQCDTRIIPMFIESVVGSTTLHRTQNWRFDPNAGRRLNPDFEAEHGHKSVILIEKLGLGIDGGQQQRKVQQALRDSVPIEDLPQNVITP